MEETRVWVKPLFQIAALYDLILGVVFFFAFKSIFTALNFPLPNHDGYIQFPALLIVVFGVASWFVAVAPARNRDIIKLGVLEKAAYAGVVLGHWAFGTIPWIWIPFAVLDVIFLALFLAALNAVAPSQ